MAMSILQAGVIGAVLAFFGLLLTAFVPTFLFIVWRTKNNVIFKITEKTAGKDVVQLLRGRREKNPEIGTVYFIPKLRKEGRQWVPFFGSQYEYPVAGKKNIVVPLIYDSGIYAPETYEYGHEVMHPYFEFVTDEKGNKKPVKKEKLIYEPIIKPISQSLFAFWIRASKLVTEEYDPNNSWWARFGTIVVGLVILVVAGVISFMMLVFAYQWATDFQEAPTWVNSFIEKIAGQVDAPENQG
jgi:acid stress-induced BolA-like protein IbaG/YrbA